MAKKLTRENLIECGLDRSTSERLVKRINPLLTSLPATACWEEISQTILTPDHPFPLHQLLYNTVFADWAGAAAPAWFPNEDEVEKTNIAAVMRELKLDSYEALHSWSVYHRADFWRLMIEQLGIQFHRKFSKVVDLSQREMSSPIGLWLRGLISLRAVLTRQAMPPRLCFSQRVRRFRG